MKTLRSQLAITALFPGLLMAHGSHAMVPGDSLLHLLAHHWPLLMGAVLSGGAWLLVRRFH